MITKISDGVKIFIDKHQSSYLFYLLLGLLAIISTVFILSGETDIAHTLGRAMALIFIFGLSYGLVEWIFSVTEEQEYWEEKEDVDENINLHVKDISELLERASEGKEKSREKLHRKIKEVFLLKLKSKKDISDEKMKDLLNDTDQLKREIGDEFISEFIIKTGQKKYKFEEEEKKVKKKNLIKYKKRYKEKIKELLIRINDWDKDEKM